MEVQTLLGDAFLTLPLLLIGFSFFFGTLTSNVGLLYLFFGHLLVVPTSSFLMNTMGRPWMENGQLNFINAIKYIISLIVSFTVIYTPTVTTPLSTSIPAIFPLFGLVHILLINFFPVESKSFANCALIPGLQEGDVPYFQPSSWLNHITFFFSYIFANALAIFEQPTPSLTASSDPDRDTDRQAKLDERVRNRKWLTTTVMIVVSIVFAILLAFRFMRTPCESGFLRSIIPMFLSYSLGFKWFELVNQKCGVRPADVLGIVQGMLSPDVADNPIVCVGS